MYLIIAGPTACGKSETAVALAAKLKSEIVSADSMQIYRGMDIGTSKITREEMKGIKHHLIDVADPEQRFTAADYKKMAESEMDAIKKRGLLPVMAGGTGLYIEAVTRGIFRESTDKAVPGLREKLNEKSAEELYAIIREKDPELALTIDPKNKRRLTRAIEIMETTGKKASELRGRAAETAYKDGYFMAVLSVEREMLYSRIDARVDKMLKQGLFDEVERLLSRGNNIEKCNSMQAIGYKEAAMHITGSLSREQAVELIKKNTRNYAKRQETWFKRYKEAFRIDVTSMSPQECALNIEQQFMERDKK